MMSAKERLHDLVDRLTDEEAEDALADLHELDEADRTRGAAAAEALARRMGPSVVSYREFATQPKRDFKALVAEQGVRPVERFEDLVGDFWPEDESVDEFVATVRQWRREGMDFSAAAGAAREIDAK